ncbi:hypothetical protein [Faecalispora jeddahensis]|uniref:hypothetical protein n=1 Tax=Faecalispora jeddahensis TaxID=1414721 RepID=UPI0027BA7A8D|nr:hypothetical protein [Faecalispora jeddahensis]
MKISGFAILESFQNKFGPFNTCYNENTIAMFKNLEKSKTDKTAKEMYKKIESMIEKDIKDDQLWLTRSHRKEFIDIVFFRNQQSTIEYPQKNIENLIDYLENTTIGSDTKPLIDPRTMKKFLDKPFSSIQDTKITTLYKIMYALSKNPAKQTDDGETIDEVDFSLFSDLPSQLRMSQKEKDELNDLKKCVDQGKLNEIGRYDGLGSFDDINKRLKLEDFVNRFSMGSEALSRTIYENLDWLQFLGIPFSNIEEVTKETDDERTPGIFGEETDNEAYEAQEFEESVNKICESLSPFEKFYLSKRINLFYAITDQAWIFICNYNLLNREAKEAFHSLQQDDIYHSFVEVLRNDRIVLEKEFKKLQRSQLDNMHNLFFGTSALKNKDHILNMLPNCVTMDEWDWENIITFERSNEKGRQKMLRRLTYLLKHNEFLDENIDIHTREKYIQQLKCLKNSKSPGTLK